MESLIVAENTKSCLSLIVAFIISFTVGLLVLSKRLSASSITIVFKVWAVTFLFLIKSAILPGVPTTIWGFISFIFFICLSILTSPISPKVVTEISEFLLNSLICETICITSSWVGANISTCISFLFISIFWNSGATKAKVFPLPV